MRAANIAAMTAATADIKEVTTVSEKEKSIAKALAEAAKVLPDEKKEYLLGYAEGVAAMASGESNRKSAKAADASRDGA